MTNHMPMFEVSKEGLAKLLEAKGKQFAIWELVANCYDEAGVTTVRVTLAPVEGRRGRCHLTVSDDSPDGFKDLAHAYTLFAESEKKSNAEQRGRFNLGEKLVLAICDEASISSTTGTIEFKDGKRQHFPRRKRDAGTVFEGIIRMTRPEYEETVQMVDMLIQPRNIQTTFNGRELSSWDEGLIASFDVTLPTVLSDAEGALRPTRRKTEVSLYASVGGAGWIYEMGIPVVVTDLPVHVNVKQKVPLNSDRDNVTPAYLKELSAHVLNKVTGMDLLTQDQAASSWINEAMEHPDIEPEAVNSILTARFGEKRVIYDPSDPEGTKLAMSKGYTVIPGRAFSGEAWKSIRSSGAALPAGKVTPSPKPYSDDPDAPVRKDYTGHVTDRMARLVRFTEKIGSHLVRRNLKVMLINDFGVPASAIYYHGSGLMEYNVARLGKVWFEQDPLADNDVLRLIIHELGHEFEGDHLSSNYHRVLCKLGARLTRLAMDEPEFIREANAVTPQGVTA